MENTLLEAQNLLPSNLRCYSIFHRLCCNFHFPTSCCSMEFVLYFSFLSNGFCGCPGGFKLTFNFSLSFRVLALSQSEGMWDFYKRSPQLNRTIGNMMWNILSIFFVLFFALSVTCVFLWSLLRLRSFLAFPLLRFFMKKKKKKSPDLLSWSTCGFSLHLGYKHWKKYQPNMPHFPSYPLCLRYTQDQRYKLTSYLSPVIGFERLFWE